MKNTFKEIPGYGGRYKIDREGNIMSRFLKKIRKQRDVRGYKCITLLHDSGRTFTGVHRLVYLAFVGPIPAGMEINHIDGNKANNNLENLELVTSSQNKLHSFRTGLHSLVGERHNNLKLNNEAVKDILISKETGISLARKYGVCNSMITRIRKRIAWSHLEV